MRPLPVLLLLLLTAHLGCLHATGHLPAGPPPEYEESPLPAATSAAAVVADAGVPPARSGTDAVLR